MTTIAPILESRGLHVSYGDVQVLWDINVRVEPGEFVALIGANGAGKTTLINTLSGIVRPVSGEVWFEGRDVAATPPWDRVASGISQVPEGRKLFYGLTVEENIRMGAFRRSDADVPRDFEWVMGLFPEVARRRRQVAGTLSGGEQQMVAIGRALMARPRILLIDELSLGLAPIVVDRLAELLTRLHREHGLTIFLVEQDVQLALEVSQRGYVLETGRITLSGPSSELLRRDEVRKAFLGM